MLRHIPRCEPGDLHQLADGSFAAPELDHELQARRFGERAKAFRYQLDCIWSQTRSRHGVSIGLARVCIYGAIGARSGAQDLGPDTVDPSGPAPLRVIGSPALFHAAYPPDMFITCVTPCARR